MENEKINWRQKLASRKFWALLAGFVIPLMAAFNFNENQIAQVVSIGAAGAAIVAYIFGESMVDSSREAQSGTYLYGELDTRGLEPAEWKSELDDE